MTFTRADLEKLLAERGRFGCYLDHAAPDCGYKCFADLDGKHAREYLESLGYTVVENGDTGGHGFARTECGIYLSTNGSLTRSA